MLRFPRLYAEILISYFVKQTLVYITPFHCRFSFWLDVEAVPARVSLAITTLLTLSTQASAARMALPEVVWFEKMEYSTLSGLLHESHRCLDGCLYDVSRFPPKKTNITAKNLPFDPKILNPLLSVLSMSKQKANVQQNSYFLTFFAEAIKCFIPSKYC